LSWDRYGFTVAVGAAGVIGVGYLNGVGWRYKRALEELAMKMIVTVAAAVLAGVAATAPSLESRGGESSWVRVNDVGAGQTLKTWFALSNVDRGFSVGYRFRSAVADAVCETSVDYRNVQAPVVTAGYSLAGNVDQTALDVSVDGPGPAFHCPNALPRPLLVTVTLPARLVEGRGIPVTTLYYNGDGAVDESDFALWSAGRFAR
jgi:hypothetical protein